MYLKYTRFFVEHTQDMIPTPQRLEDTKQNMNISWRDGEDNK